MESDRTQRTLDGPSPPKACERLWNLRWRDHFPISLPGGYLATVGDWAHARAFLGMHAARIYDVKQGDGRFLAGEESAAKRRFHEETVDVFLLRQGSSEGPVVGILTGNPLDWSSYYFRNVSLLPECQDAGLFQPLFVRLLAGLETAGVERAETEIAPSNYRQLHLLNKLGFQVTGTALSERWGAMTRLTRFFSARHRAAFERQFCLAARLEPAVSWSQPEGNS